MQSFKYIPLLSGLFICWCYQALGSGFSTRNSLYEDLYLPINGTRQFVSIKSRDTRNPVLLFLHGGPGASATVLFQKKNRTLENDFTVVCWDQRGAGRSYSRNLSKNSITVPQIIYDAESVIKYLSTRFNQQKIFLVGHSWGARLGMYLALLYPEYIAGYIAVGQEVSAFEGELGSWKYTYEQAKKFNNAKALKDLEEMGQPGSGNYMTMYKTGFWGIVKQKEWLLKLGGERYARTNYKDWMGQMLNGYHYNIFQLIRWSKASASTASAMFADSAFNNFDLRKDIPAVQVPVHFLSGLVDFNTPWPLVKEYAELLSAPEKSFTIFDKSGHSPLFEEPDRFNAFVKAKFLGE